MTVQKLADDSWRCPTCDQKLRVEPRGAHQWIARCPGGLDAGYVGDPAYILGCHAEFGDSPQEAVNAVLEIVL